MFIHSEYTKIFYSNSLTETRFNDMVNRMNR